MRQPRLLRLSFFIWLAIPIAAYLAYLTFGLPHLIWSYDWRDNGTYDPAAQRYYTRCTYIGWYGAVTEYPTDGRCGWLRFAKSTGLRP